MLWKIQEICSKMGTKFFEIDEKMSEIIDAKVGNPQNSTSKKLANLSQCWNLAFFQYYILKKYVHFQSQRVPKWKIAHIWQSKEHKNNKKTPKNGSHIGLQSWPDVLQHPVETHTWMKNEWGDDYERFCSLEMISRYQRDGSVLLILCQCSASDEPIPPEQEPW